MELLEAEADLVVMETMAVEEVRLTVLICRTTEVQTRAIFSVIIARSMVICKLTVGRNKMRKSKQVLLNKQMCSKKLCNPDFSWHTKV